MNILWPNIVKWSLPPAAHLQERSIPNDNDAMYIEVYYIDAFVLQQYIFKSFEFWQYIDIVNKFHSIHLDQIWQF